tara:strand:- start:127 stop:429 length:303 start_codon:yes stop_codon:yes gene_type:complete
MDPDIIGYIASILYIFSLLPEVYSVYKTKKCLLPISFLVLQFITTIFFIIYDVLINSTPLLVADILLSFELVYLSIFKYTTYKKNKKNISQIYNSQSTWV